MWIFYIESAKSRLSQSGTDRNISDRQRHFAQNRLLEGVPRVMVKTVCLALLMAAAGVASAAGAGDVSLWSAVHALRTVAGTVPGGTGADVDYDGRIGLPEVIYALQSAAGRKPQDDPLTPFQWHLRNAGQTTFSPCGGTPQEDMHMTQTAFDGITGDGVVVAVVDSGLEIAHEDLAANVVPGGSYNFTNQTTDPTPTGAGGDHGTSVAGIIAAVAGNGVGGRGVAPEAGLKGFNAIETNAPADFIAALGGNPDLSGDVDVFNMSFGEDGTRYFPMSQTVQDLFEASAALRSGRGAVYVKSSGNGFEDFTLEDDSPYACSQDTAYPPAIRALDVTCHNAVGDEMSARPEIVVVGAYNAAGKKATYSTAGSALWVAAPGGEYGSDAPAILTTDVSGCDRGYSKDAALFTEGSPANDFETGDPDTDGRFNPQCRYTSAFNGTSSAAPNASGAVALMLDANPALTRRDVKDILARTARPIDPDIPLLTVPINGVDLVVRLPWITNTAGFRFHNWYGFGAVDVDAAVAMAASWPSPSPLGTPQERQYGGLLDTPASIPDADAAGLQTAIAVSEDVVVETLSLAVAIDHPNTGELAVMLTSPGGTTSILLNLRSNIKTGLYALDDEGAVSPAALPSNAFYGESSQGTWQVRVVDGVSGNTGTLVYAAIVFIGR